MACFGMYLVIGKTKATKNKKMKAIIFTLSTLAILIGSKIDKNLNSRMESYFSSASLENSMIVEATNHEREAIPIVDLLTFDVFGIVDARNKVITTVVDGDRIPVVTLPELDIVASK